MASIQARLGTQVPAPGERLTQVDTYFRAAHGRLKLREIISAHGASSELIQYSRPDELGARTSTYRRVPLSVDQAEALKTALTDALHGLVTVRKQRIVAVWRSTRIHLDRVESLGHFVELETVLDPDDLDETRGRAEFNSVFDWLGLAGLESVPGSYSDLIIRKGLPRE
jgi:adenylate cyclase class IV